MSTSASSHPNTSATLPVVETLGWVAVGLFWLLTQAVTVDQIAWLLKPTVWMVSAITGQLFSYQDGLGFVRSDGLVLIHKGCSGLNFWVIALALTWMHGVAFLKTSKRFIATLTILLLPLFVTILANTSRILMSIQLEHIPLDTFLHLSKSGVHLAIGMMTYLTMLFLYYLMIRSLSDVIRKYGV